jgi:hypothetical protein
VDTETNQGHPRYRIKEAEISISAVPQESQIKSNHHHQCPPIRASYAPSQAHLPCKHEEQHRTCPFKNTPSPLSSPSSICIFIPISIHQASPTPQFRDLSAFHASKWRSYECQPHDRPKNSLRVTQNWDPSSCLTSPVCACVLSLTAP